jgi:hypothetical protein
VVLPNAITTANNAIQKIATINQQLAGSIQTAAAPQVPL